MQEPTTARRQRRDIERAAYERRDAEDGDYATLITEPTIVEDAATGEVVIVYLAPLEEDTRILVDVLRHTHTPMTDRMSGMQSQWRTFGSRPPNGLRNLPCGPAALAREDPHGHTIIFSYAPVIARYYAQYGPAVYARAGRKARQVLPAWTLNGGPFTSGIVNRDGRLPYHTDKSNVRNVWSGMLGLKRGVTGGYLAVPEYDLALEVADKSLTLFDGQALLHGVTPFHIAAGGHRFTVVFYSRAGMVRCLRPGKEAARRAQ